MTEDVGDDAQALQPRWTRNENSPEGPERVAGELERLHSEGDADDRDAEDEPSKHLGKREPEPGQDEPNDVENGPQGEHRASGRRCRASRAARAGRKVACGDPSLNRWASG
jgi:hypothetical protein